jgi:hypothetical protein
MLCLRYHAWTLATSSAELEEAEVVLFQLIVTYVNVQTPGQ